MDSQIFNTINMHWNQLRASGAPNLKAAVPGLIDPSRILVKRVGESPTTLTLMFSGFDQALDNPPKDGPMLNRAIFAWVRKMAEAQIVRGGDDSTFTVMVRKPPEPTPQAAPQPALQAAPAQPMQMETRRSLVRISSVRRIDG